MKANQLSEVEGCLYSALRHKQTPGRTQWEICMVVNRSASNTNPTPIAFLLKDVVYTGVRSVFCGTKHKSIHRKVRQKHQNSELKYGMKPVELVVHTCNLRWRASMGMTLRMGSSTTRTFGLLLTRQPSSVSQSAPSRYRPDTKQPTGKKTL